MSDMDGVASLCVSVKEERTWSATIISRSDTGYKGGKVVLARCGENRLWRSVKHTVLSQLEPNLPQHVRLMPL